VHLDSLGTFTLSQRLGKGAGGPSRWRPVQNRCLAIAAAAGPPPRIDFWPFLDGGRLCKGAGAPRRLRLVQNRRLAVAAAVGPSPRINFLPFLDCGGGASSTGDTTIVPFFGGSGGTTTCRTVLLEPPGSTMASTMRQMATNTPAATTPLQVGRPFTASYLPLWSA